MATTLNSFLKLQPYSVQRAYIILRIQKKFSKNSYETIAQ